MFLAGNDPGGGGVAGQNDMLQILYDARGHQIAKLQKELSLAEAGQEQELRTLRHQLALAKGEKESLTARTEHLTDVADGQVEENRCGPLTPTMRAFCDIFSQTLTYSWQKSFLQIILGLKLAQKSLC